MLPPLLLFSPLPPPLKSTLYCYLSTSILISSPQMHPPIFPFCCLSLLPRLRQWRTFSISAQLLQINDLICRNKQVSSTLGPFASSALSLSTFQKELNERERLQKVRKNEGVFATARVFPPHLSKPSALSDSSTMSYCLSASTTWFTSYDFSHFTGHSHTQKVCMWICVCVCVLV